MQQILEKRKIYFIEDDVLYRPIPKYAEFSVKSVIENGYLSKKTIKDYFPDDPYKVDREWMWRIWMKTDKEKALKFLSKVETEKNK